MPSLTYIFSSVPFRGFYPDEQPEVPFRTEGTKQEKKRLAFLINKIARSSKFGRSVLEHAAKEGYSLSFETMGRSRGAASSDLKKIVLNPRCSDSVLTATLTHESRHAEQFSNGAVCGFFKEGRTFSSLLKEERLMEADAVASSVAVCFDLDRCGDRKPLEKLYDSYSHCVRAFGSSADTERNKALTQSALAWYDDTEIKFLYEFYGFVSSVSCGQDIAPAGTKREDPTSEQLVSKICRNEEGKSYFCMSPSALDTSRRAGISDITAAWLANHAKACRANGVSDGETDASLSKIPVYELQSYMRNKVERFFIYPDPLNERGVMQAQKVVSERNAISDKSLFAVSALKKNKGRD